MEIRFRLVDRTCGSVETEVRGGIVDDGWMGEMMLGQEEIFETKTIPGNISFHVSHHSL